MIYGNVLNLSEETIAQANLEAEYLAYLEQDIYDYGLDVLNEKFNPKTGTGGKLRPVFVVLLYSDGPFPHMAEKFVKDQEYWHAGFAFSPNLDRIYSFSYAAPETVQSGHRGGLCYESIDYFRKTCPTGRLFVGAILVTNYKYRKLKECLNYYIKNKEKTKYDFPNLVRSLFGFKTKNGWKTNLVCSTFVDTVLKSAKIDLNQGKQTNLVKPDDLKAKNGEKQYTIFEGKVPDYDEKKAAKIVEKMVDNESYNFFGK